MSKYKKGDILLYKNTLKIVIEDVYPSVPISNTMMSIGYYVYNNGDLLTIEQTDNNSDIKLSLKHKFEEL